MAERETRRRLNTEDLRRAGWPRWAALGAAAVVLVVFLLAQRQSTAVSYGESPTSTAPITEGSAGELSQASVPSTEEMTAMVRASPVVRLPGSVAGWDEQRVRAAIGDANVHILVAPPGLDEGERQRVRDVQEAQVRVVGTEVNGSIYRAGAESLDGWRAQFATADVTDLLLTMIAEVREQPSPPAEKPRFTWREPTAAELTPVAEGLSRGPLYLAPGATLTAVPERAAASAFPGRPALYAAFPSQPSGAPVPHYGSALAARFPDTPIVVLYGSWIEYQGPNAADFADVVAASFYGQFEERISTYAYPQGNVLNAYLNRVTDVRYAGLFEQPLPYQPFDPVRVALPVLPWLFAACVVVFLVLSARTLRLPGGRTGPGSTPARLAGLTALAIEMSGLTGKAGNPALTRGLGKLRDAGTAVEQKLPGRYVTTLLNEAERELDDTAKTLGRNDYRPQVYLRGGLA